MVNLRESFQIFNAKRVSFGGSGMGIITKNIISFSAVITVLISILNFNEFAYSMTCSSLFETSSGVALKSVESQIEEHFKKASDGISTRGFLAAEPALSLESKESAYSKGMMFWGLRIYVQPTLVEAILHSKEVTDPIMQGVYLIGEKLPSDTKMVPAPHFFRKLLGNGLYYIENGQVVRHDFLEIQDRFVPEKMEWSISEPERGPYIYQRGWFFPKVRGVIRSEFTAESETYKKLRKLARSLYKKGFRITFNQNYQKALEMVAQQERRGQISGGSRYNDAEFFNESLTSFIAGKAFSVEVWDSEGRLVGGNLGVVSRNLYAPDSVFYDTQNYKNGIDFAKISIMAIMDRLSQHGINFVDAGMVTKFTASMKGRYISGGEFLYLIKTLPTQKIEVDFKSEWVP